MNNIILDATTLSSLMACPRMCDYSINRSLKPIEGKSNSLECGSLVHIILEWYNKSLIAGSSRTAAIADGYEAGMEYINGYKPTNKYLTENDPDEFMHNTPEESGKIGKRELTGWKFVMKTMEEYFDFWKNSHWLPLAAEEVKGEIIYEDDELRILWKAKFDEIDDTNQGFISMDHKTMKQRKDALTLNNQFIGQCILLKSRNIVINKIGFQTSLKPEEKFTRQMISYTADKMAEWANDIVPYYARLLIAFNEAGHYPANYTHCENKYGWCQYKEACESDRNMREEILRVNFKIGNKKWDI